jgi:hypothetical protein
MSEDIAAQLVARAAMRETDYFDAKAMEAAAEEILDLRALALSLADALELTKDICWREGWTTATADAALASPALVRLRGK